MTVLTLSQFPLFDVHNTFGFGYYYPRMRRGCLSADEFVTFPQINLQFYYNNHLESVALFLLFFTVYSPQQQK